MPSLGPCRWTSVSTFPTGRPPLHWPWPIHHPRLRWRSRRYPLKRWCPPPDRLPVSCRHRPQRRRHPHPLQLYPRLPQPLQRRWLRCHRLHPHLLGAPKCPWRPQQPPGLPRHPLRPPRPRPPRWRPPRRLHRRQQLQRSGWWFRWVRSPKRRGRRRCASGWSVRACGHTPRWPIRPTVLGFASAWARSTHVPKPNELPNRFGNWVFRPPF